MMIRRLVGEISLLPPEWSITVTRATQSLLDWKKREEASTQCFIWVPEGEDLYMVNFPLTNKIANNHHKYFFYAIVLRTSHDDGVFNFYHFDITVYP